MSEARGLREWVEDALPAGWAARLTHDGADHVHQLRKARDLYAVRVVHQGDEHTADDQGVLEVVHLLDQPWRPRPAGLAQVGRPVRLVPDVPFIEGEHEWNVWYKAHAPSDLRK